MHENKKSDLNMLGVLGQSNAGFPTRLKRKNPVNSAKSPFKRGLEIGCNQRISELMKSNRKK